MKTIRYSVLLLLVHAVAFAQWVTIGPGIRYAEFDKGDKKAHVSRIDLHEPDIRIISSSESEKGMRTSDWAARKKTLVAINGDYFDDKHKPIGLALGPCGVWEGTRDTRREGVLAVGRNRIEISAQKAVIDPVPEWVDQAVSGWPLIVDDCEALSSSELPGSDAFTRSPHPRTAVGVSGDGRFLFFVVVEGRLEGRPGITLAELAEFMEEELGVCRALNLDGGGSSTMVVGGEVQNQLPAEERWVANHIGVVLARDYTGCETGE